MRIDPSFKEQALEGALKAGADYAELFLRTGQTLSIESKGGAVDTVDKAVSFGYGLRVIKSRRLGFAYSNDPDRLTATIEQALGAAGLTAEEDSLAIPEPSGTESLVPGGTFDREVAEVPEAEAVRHAIEIEAAARGYDPKITKVRKAKARFSSAETSISNSLGLSAGYASTYTEASIMCVAEAGEESQMGWGYQAGRWLTGVDFKKVGLEAAERAVQMLGARRATPCKATIVLDNSVAAEFLSEFASMLSAEAVQKGKSLLKGKLGQPVMSKCMDIIDDGLMSKAPGARPMDDEGLPTYRKPLIRQGVLEGFMHNSQTARKEGLKSTSNAVRSGYSGLPYVGPINILIEGKVTPLSDLLGSVGTGLYVLDAMGMHTVNPVSGEFSIGVSGLWIEGGKVSHPVKEMVISGNLMDFFGKVEALGDDLRFYGDVGSPSLLISGVDLSA